MTAMLIFSSTILSICQVKRIELFTVYNFQTKVFDCGFIVKEGQAKNLKDRVQFNSSCSFVVPTGAKFKIINEKMPLLYNENYQGNVPTKWEIFSFIESPDIDIKHDYYQVGPNLSPTAYYNDLYEGDTVFLFSIETNKIYCADEVRLYHNEKDIDLVPYDFENGFSIGGVQQLYSGNKYMESSYKFILPIKDNEIYCHHDFFEKIKGLEGDFTFSDTSILNLNPFDFNDKIRVKYEDKNSGCIIQFDSIQIINLQLPTIEKVQFRVEEVLALPTVNNAWWYSTNDEVAMIDNTGKLLAIKPGIVSIGLKEKVNECSSPLLPIEVMQPTAVTHSDLQKIEIYPNPATDVVRIKTKEKISSLAILDVQGNYISSHEYVKNLSKLEEIEIEISGLINGIYFLELSISDKKEVITLIKSQ
jgi:hypothetical protein